MRLRNLICCVLVGVMCLTRPAAAEAPDAVRVAEIARRVTPGTFSATPSIEARDFWEKVQASKLYQSAVADARQVPRESFAPLPDELYLDYSRTGNRARYESVYFRKLKALRNLVVAECVEHRGEFLPTIQEVIASYAADKSWVLPAHDGALHNFHGRQVTIDLFSSEVACDLANTDFLLGDRLDADTRALVRAEVARRIFVPYERMVREEQPSLYWLTITNNWNAVCLANVTSAALALIEDPAERTFYVAAAEKYVAYFLDGFTDDGYCSEGIAYWNYGYGCFVRLGHILHGATGGYVDLFAAPRARSAGLFARRMELTPGCYPAFADCGVQNTPSREIMAYVSHHYGLTPSDWEERGFGHLRWLDEFGVFAFVFEPSTPDVPTESAALRDWFKDAGILICRGAQTPRGLPVAVALKGGHNAEHHNHNDLGSYVVGVGANLPLVDPGAEVYTRRTFSAERYVSNLLNSFGHAVPRVAEQLQRTGHDAHAEVLRLDLTDDQDTLALDLTSAYAVPTLQQVTRTFTFHRPTAQLTVTDEVHFTAPERFETALITFDSWQQLEPNLIRVGDAETGVDIHLDTGGLAFTLQATTIDEEIRGDRQPIRLGINLDDPVEHAVVRATIRPAAAGPAGASE